MDPPSYNIYYAADGDCQSGIIGSDRAVFGSASDAGGGTRTPDTRIMIGVNC
jgi:hypothetical protein